MTAPRHQGLDALRGWAIAAMVLYHFVFDLKILIGVPIDFTQTPWIEIRAAIVSVFLFCVGVAAGIAPTRSQQKFSRRWLEIAAAALLVTLGSYAMFPNEYIYFGVLHGIALMLLLLRATQRYVAWFPVAALVVLFVGMLIKHTWFDQSFLHWIGLMTYRPHTMDYVPVLPWMAWVWIGYFVATKPLALKLLQHIKAPRLLFTASRYPLVIYLVHQPILLTLLLLYLLVKV